MFGKANTVTTAHAENPTLVIARFPFNASEIGPHKNAPSTPPNSDQKTSPAAAVKLSSHDSSMNRVAQSLSALIVKYVHKSEKQRSANDGLASRLRHEPAKMDFADVGLGSFVAVVAVVVVISVSVVVRFAGRNGYNSTAHAIDADPATANDARHEYSFETLRKSKGLSM